MVPSTVKRFHDQVLSDSTTGSNSHRARSRSGLENREREKASNFKQLKFLTEVSYDKNLNSKFMFFYVDTDNNIILSPL